MRKSLRVIMLMRVDFLSQMLQSKANTGGLIFLLRASQSKEGWRVNVRPVALSVYVRKCLCSCVYPNVSLSVCAFSSEWDPSACRCWCHLLPWQSKATAEWQFLRDLIYRQFTCMPLLLECAICSTPVAENWHEGNFFSTRRQGQKNTISSYSIWSWNMSQDTLLVSIDIVVDHCLPHFTYYKHILFPVQEIGIWIQFRNVKMHQWHYELEYSTER